MSEELNSYERELEALDETYSSAMKADINNLKEAIASASESSIIGVGSGGSFTVASLLCTLHEAYTGRVSRASTPLEIISNPTLASASPVFLISAEGKNPDAREALTRARIHSSRAIHLITNRKDSPLTQLSGTLTDIGSHVFELTQKDGYLATNSLLMDAVLIARAYGELDEAKGSLLPTQLNELKLGDQTILEWLECTTDFLENTIERGNIIVVFSPLVQPVVIDFESKLSEAALLHSQFSDIRSFAHGRHLWLTDRDADCAILSVVEPELSKLWEQMKSCIPNQIPSLYMPLNGSKPKDLLAGLVAQMHLIGKLARLLGKDPSRPEVSEIARKLYYSELSELIPKPENSDSLAKISKLEVLGAKWPSKLKHGFIDREYINYKNELNAQKFKAIVFDYDGTLCSSQRKDLPPDGRILQKLRELIDSKVVIGIATGRGGSIQEILRESLPKEYWSKIWLGLYNAGQILSVDEEKKELEETSEFLNNVKRIMNQLKYLGVPIKDVRITQPYQISVRFREGISTEYMWFVVADAIRRSGLDSSRVVASKHSIDVLSNEVNKSRLVAHVIQECCIEPYSIVTVGDQGAWPGNDYALLEHRYSLSVDVPTRNTARGWNLAPVNKRGVDATLWYLNNLKIHDGFFQTNL